MTKNESLQTILSHFPTEGVMRSGGKNDRRWLFNRAIVIHGGHSYYRALHIAG